MDFQRAEARMRRRTSKPVARGRLMSSRKTWGTGAAGSVSARFEEIEGFFAVGDDVDFDGEAGDAEGCPGEEGVRVIVFRQQNV
jgi:hypothetical protein